ncbi:MAG: hypothetical protein RL662_1311, partial [Bacteroidota bacterium]
MIKSYLFVYITVVVFFCSCGSTQNISYFQDLDQFSYLRAEASRLDSVYQATIKPKDELAIVVSSIEPQAVQPFNLPSGQGKIVSYLVNSEGDINFPTLGKISLGGLTTE